MTAPVRRKGPSAYENWKAALVDAISEETVEYPLFTDANIIGEIREGYGPYKFLNTVPMATNARINVPAIILRVEYYIRNDVSTLNIKETDVDLYHGGLLEDEMAALLSLSLGIRLKAGGATRRFLSGGDPKGYPVAHEAEYDPVFTTFSRFGSVLPRALGDHSLEDSVLLPRLSDITPNEAITLIRAARLYQDAVWIAESEPELSWIMLVSAAETAAGYWRAANESPEERLKASRIGQDLEKTLEESGCQTLLPKLAALFADYMGVTKKFVDFLLKFMPEPPKERPPEFFQHSWARPTMKKSLETIYRWRSRALHGGIPFPLPMCLAPRKYEGGFEENPLGGAMAAQNAIWLSKDTPMLLHTFEYIVRHALLDWWASMLPKGQEAT